MMINFDLRHLGHADRAEGVEVRLDHRAVLDGDAAEEQRRQPIDERARDLPLDLRRVDRVAGIGRRDDAVHLDLVAAVTEISAAAAT